MPRLSSPLLPEKQRRGSRQFGKKRQRALEHVGGKKVKVTQVGAPFQLENPRQRVQPLQAAGKAESAGVVRMVCHPADFVFFRQPADQFQFRRIVRGR